jgi:hypothetical protein
VGTKARRLFPRQPGVGQGTDAIACAFGVVRQAPGVDRPGGHVLEDRKYRGVDGCQTPGWDDLLQGGAGQLVAKSDQSVR